MSYEATRTVWAFIRSHDELEASDVLVLLALADRMNVKTGLINPSLSRLASDCHCAQRTVQRAIDRLMKIGIVVRKSGGEGKSNRYLIMATVGGNRGRDDHSHSDHSQDDHTTLDTMTTDSGHDDAGPWSQWPTNQEKNQKETSAQPPSPATASGDGSAAPEWLSTEDNLRHLRLITETLLKKKVSA